MQCRNMLTALVITLISASPAWAVYKCMDDAGKTVYQQHPCTATGSVGSQINATPSITTGGEEDGTAQARLDAIKSFNRRFDAAANQEVMRGMTRAQVQMAWGQPSKINSSIGSYGKHEQWVYRRGAGAAQYIYFENGIVTSMQD